MYVSRMYRVAYSLILQHTVLSFAIHDRAATQVVKGNAQAVYQAGEGEDNANDHPR